MSSLSALLAKNKEWSERIRKQDPGFFENLSRQQAPQYLWIGCSDSRVPANQIVGLLPGEIFVHRNIANMVVHTDLNCLSVIQFAVDVLKIRHIIVCGHYGCSGVSAALRNTRLGLVNNWLRHVQDVYRKHETSLLEISEEDTRINRLCELNVIEQVHNLCQTTMVMDAWDRGQELTIHGWVYGLHDGLLRELSLRINSPNELLPAYSAAVHEASTRASDTELSLKHT